MVQTADKLDDAFVILEQIKYVYLSSDKSFKGSDKLKITLSEKRTSVIYEYKTEG